MHISAKTALEDLAKHNELFIELFKHGTLSIEVYKPGEKDLQQPHEKDEIYIIISGEGEFVNGNELVQFKTGDFLFVAAGVKHRFINYSNDFSTWVIFYGPRGGEKNAPL